MGTLRSAPPEPRHSVAPSADEDRGSHVMRFGAAVSAVLLSSVIATMPATVRVAGSVAGSVSGMGVWLALLALAFLPLAVITVTLRRALAALRLFDPKDLAAGVAAVLLWGAMTLVALTALGAVLRATTHHHGLAGLAFGCGGFVMAALLGLVAARVVAWCRVAPAALRWAALTSGAVGVTLLVACFARALASSDAGSPLAVDLVALALGGAFGAGAFPYRSRPFAPLALAGPPLAAIVLVVGLGTLRRSPPLRAAVADEAPVLAATRTLPGVDRATTEGAH